MVASPILVDMMIDDVGASEARAAGPPAPLDPNEALAFDQAHLWHPYTSIPAEPAPLLATSASGCRLEVRLPDGSERSLIDGMSSWWAAVHGYSHPALLEAAHRQLDTMSHVMFGGLTHQPAVELGRRLVDLTPAGLERVFFSDSGSVAVEVSVKMALQYWRSKGRPDKRQLLTWRSGYHGDTFMAMSACDPEGGMHSLWSGVVPTQRFVGAPPSSLKYTRPLPVSTIAIRLPRAPAGTGKLLTPPPVNLTACPVSEFRSASTIASAISVAVGPL